MLACSLLYRLDEEAASRVGSVTRRSPATGPPPYCRMLSAAQGPGEVVIRPRDGCLSVHQSLRGVMIGGHSRPFCGAWCDVNAATLSSLEASKEDE